MARLPLFGALHPFDLPAPMGVERTGLCCFAPATFRPPAFPFKGPPRYFQASALEPFTCLTPKEVTHDVTPTTGCEHVLLLAQWRGVFPTLTRPAQGEHATTEAHPSRYRSDAIALSRRHPSGAHRSMRPRPPFRILALATVMATCLPYLANILSPSVMLGVGVATIALTAYALWRTWKWERHRALHPTTDF